MEIEERFWSKVDWDAHDETRCWPWRARKSQQGYGTFIVIDQFRGQAHRMAYELEVGSIPEGYVIDHRCHDPKTCEGGPACPHRRCCNPSHMKLVTISENLSLDRAIKHHGRKTHCPQGHEYTAENTYVAAKGRTCKTCAKANAKKNR